MAQFSKECVLEDVKMTAYVKDINKYNLENQLVWLHELLLLLTLRERVHANVLEDIQINKNGYYVFYPSRAQQDLALKGFSVPCLLVLRNFRNNYVHQGPSEARSYFNVLCKEYKKELKALANYAGVSLHFNVVLYNIIKK